MFISFYHFWKYPSNRLKTAETKLRIPEKFSFSTQTRNMLMYLIAVPSTIIDFGDYIMLDTLRPSKDTKLYGGVGEFPYWFITALYLDSQQCLHVQLYFTFQFGSGDVKLRKKIYCLNMEIHKEYMKNRILVS